MQTQLMFSQEDFPANHSQLPGNEKAKMMNATCGTKCYEQLKRLNRNLSSQKMSMVSQILMGEWYSSRCALTWKLVGTKYNRILFRLVPKTLRTEEIGFGLLPTATAQDFKRRGPNSKQQGLSNTENWVGMLPTPRVKGDGNSHQRIKDGRIDDLTTMARFGLLPTPTKSDYNARGNQPNWKGDDLVSHIHRTTSQTGTTSQLNPLFVAEMMGFPTDWTLLPFQSGETKVSKHTETQ